MKKRKILWFSPVPINQDSKGGSWVVTLAEELSSRENIELHVAFRSKSENILKSVKGNIITWQIPSDDLSKTKINMKNLLNIEINKEIDNFFNEIIFSINPDIIQVFGTESILARSILTTKIPSVIHIQCIYQIYHYKFFSGISSSDVRNYSSFKSKFLKRTMLDVYKQKQEVVLRERLFYKTCKNFIGRTDWDRRCSSILAPNSNYFHCDEVMRNIFFVNKWEKGKVDRKLVLISLVSSMIYKGLETIIEAYSLLRNSLDDEVIWNVVGLSEDQDIVSICKKKYRTKFENIKFLGKKSGEEIVEIMKSSDIYVHPSHIENSPNSVCEAMLIGMPVIATDTGGTSSLVENKVNGILIQDGDPWSMAGAIKELHQDANRAKIMGQKARETATVRHDPKRISENLLEVYDKIISGEKN